MNINTKVIRQVSNRSHVKSALRLFSNGSKLWSHSIQTLENILNKEIEATHSAGTYKVERAIASPISARIELGSTKEGGSKTELCLCANNYLGLSNNAEVVSNAKKYLELYGAGLSSVRFICGTQTIHKELEAQISNFFGTKDTILYPSCFDANAGLFEVLLNSEDAVISDALNHASIIDGIRLCKAKRFRYANADMQDLEKQLQEADKQGARLKLIATDGVFSMDGRVAPLDKICDLADKYNALVFIDECHATGFMGNTGRGTAEHFGVQNRVHIINSTLGKALGGAAGGFTTSTSPQVIELLRQRARPYLFSNSLAPSIVGAASKAIELVDSDSNIRNRLWKNTRLLRQLLSEAGFTIKGDDHPIIPVMLGDARLANMFAQEMAKQGIYVIGFSYPVVPKEQARIRVQMSAVLTEQDVHEAANAFIKVGKHLKVI